VATSFKVVTDQVEALASRMDQISSSFQQVEGRDVSYRGYADAAPVDDGLGEFFGKWTDGMDRIHKKIDGLADRLHYASETYEMTEAKIIEAATPPS
jgi:hypothetical protein